MLIVDVRAPEEFGKGRIEGSINIPIDQIRDRSKELPKNEPIILCCGSGMRSGRAESILKDMGFQNVINGGSWKDLISQEE